MSTESSAGHDPLAPSVTAPSEPASGKTDGAGSAAPTIAVPKTGSDREDAAPATLETVTESPAAPSARAQVAAQAKDALSSIASGLATLVTALFAFVLTVCPFVERKAFRHGVAAVVWATAFGFAWYAFGIGAALLACLILYGATCLHLWQPPSRT